MRTFIFLHDVRNTLNNAELRIQKLKPKYGGFWTHSWVSVSVPTITLTRFWKPKRVKSSRGTIEVPISPHMQNHSIFYVHGHLNFLAVGLSAIFGVCLSPTSCTAKCGLKNNSGCVCYSMLTVKTSKSRRTYEERLYPQMASWCSGFYPICSTVLSLKIWWLRIIRRYFCLHLIIFFFHLFIP